MDELTDGLIEGLEQAGEPILKMAGAGMDEGVDMAGDN